MSDLTSPLGGDDLAKARRDAYGQGRKHAAPGVWNPAMTEDQHGAVRDAWIAQYIARLPAAEPIAAAPEARVGKDGLGDGRAICEALGFDPTNHHNAERCPYCNPNGWTLQPSPEAGAGGDLVSRDFQLMLARIIARHGKGLDLTDTIAGARDLLARKGSLSPLRDAEPEATPKSSPDQTPVDPQMTVEEAREAAYEAAADKLDAIGRHHGWFNISPSTKNTPWRELDPIGREEFLDAAAAIAEAVLRTLQAGGEVQDA